VPALRDRRGGERAGFRELVEGEVLAVPRGLTEIEAL
jgi:hypothetical protein